MELTQQPRYWTTSMIAATIRYPVNLVMYQSVRHTCQLVHTPEQSAGLSESATRSASTCSTFSVGGNSCSIVSSWHPRGRRLSPAEQRVHDFVGGAGPRGMDACPRWECQPSPADRPRRAVDAGTCLPAQSRRVHLGAGREVARQAPGTDSSLSLTSRSPKFQTTASTLT